MQEKKILDLGQFMAGEHIPKDTMKELLGVDDNTLKQLKSFHKRLSPQQVELIVAKYGDKKVARFLVSEEYVRASVNPYGYVTSWLEESVTPERKELEEEIAWLHENTEKKTLSPDESYKRSLAVIEALRQENERLRNELHACQELLRNYTNPQ